MVKVLFFLISLSWFLILFPQVVKAQAEKEPGTEALSQGTLLPSEPEARSVEAMEDTGMEPRVVQFGDFHLQFGETVQSVILLGGDARIQGRVLGDILVLKGNAEIKKEAEVMGKVRVILGKINDESNKLENAVEINGWRLLPESISLIMRPQEIWGMSFWWSVLTLGTLTVIHILLASTFSEQMGNMAYVVSHRPVGSTLLGALVLIAVPYFVVVLVYSIIGIPLMLLFCSVLLPMAIYGKTAIFLSMGSTIFPKQSSVIAVIVGYLIYRMATAIPYIDWLTFVVASTIGVGVCIRTAFGQKSIRSPQKIHPSRRSHYSLPKKYRTYND